jgi:hypothetical protein
LFEGKGVSTSRVSPPGPLSLPHGARLTEAVAAARARAVEHHRTAPHRQRIERGSLRVSSGGGGGSVGLDSSRCEAGRLGDEPRRGRGVGGKRREGDEVLRPRAFLQHGERPHVLYQRPPPLRNTAPYEYLQRQPRRVPAVGHYEVLVNTSEIQGEGCELLEPSGQSRLG